MSDGEFSGLMNTLAVLIADQFFGLVEPQITKQGTNRIRGAAGL